jgi:hypothetical protein
MPASVRAMLSAWATGGPAQTQTQKQVWQFLGGATTTFTVTTMIADSPFRQLAWGHFVYGGLLAVLPSALLIALLAPLVSYRRRDVLLLLVPLWNLVTVWTIGSRISRLPCRDWPLRLDESNKEAHSPAGADCQLPSVPFPGAPRSASQAEGATSFRCRRATRQSQELSFQPRSGAAVRASGTRWSRRWRPLSCCARCALRTPRADRGYGLAPCGAASSAAGRSAPRARPAGRRQ